MGIPTHPIHNEQWLAKSALDLFWAGVEAFDAAFGFQAIDFDGLGELVDRGVAGFVADFQAEEDLARAAGVVFPDVLAVVRQDPGILAKNSLTL